jgi:class 3 adenylate cyclase
VLTGRYPRDVPLPIVWLLTLGVAALSAFVFLRRSPLVGSLFGIALAVVIAFISYQIFKFDRLIPTAALQFAVLLAFLLTLALRLTGEERERRRLRSMFGSYVSDDVVDLLIAKRGEGEGIDLRGEEMVVTVLFSDIRSFTTISEKLTAHEVVEMLNTYFGKVCEPILNERGNVNKYIGDAVMAMFGSPVPYPDHAKRAVRAALGMLKATDEFRTWMETRFPDRGLPRFDIGIGLHTGTVISGDIGTDRRREYTIIGDTVNTASRLEGMTKELGWRIVASRATLEAAGEGVITGEGSSIHVKGRAAEVNVVEIVGVTAPDTGA